MSFLKKLKELFQDEAPVVVEAPAPKPLAKRTKKLVAKEEIVDVGVTSVLLEFDDKRQLVTRVYGKFQQYANKGHDEQYRNAFNDDTKIEPLVEPQISVSTIYSSINEAEQFISTIGNYDLTTYVDDPRKPTKSEVGKVLTATIIKTEPCLDKVTKYSVEDV